jgi:hypothetical protein
MNCQGVSLTHWRGVVDSRFYGKPDGEDGPVDERDDRLRLRFGLPAGAGDASRYDEGELHLRPGQALRQCPRE